MSEYPRDLAGHEPTSPTSLTSSESRPKKINPLNDLIDTERLFVEQLTGVIRRIAAAWSRINLPPPELDSMFRSIEAVYKANKSLYSRLKDIGTNPASPKVLGDLLMKWITDLDTPYTNYCTNYCTGFDDWEPVKSNHKLPEVLKAFTMSFPPSSSEQLLWTLDTVFLLPKGRLKYYRKLYNRLLKGTVAGRSDYRLLVSALEKLNALLNTLESRQSVRVGQSNSLASLKQEIEDEVVVDLRTQSVLNDVENSAMPSSVADQNIYPRETNVPEGKSPAVVHDTPPSEPETNSIPVRDLEIRLSTARTLDIFTMNPKAVRLQFSPHNLTFSREMRLSLDVLIRFTPRVTNTEVIHRRGHVFILSDLFLICERMTLQDKAQRVSGAEDMWLCYPPLAGKVLRVAEVDGQSHALQVTVMKKEFLFVETVSIDTRNALMGHLRECIEFSGSLPPPSKELPPPVPPLNVPPDKNAIRPNPEQLRNTPLSHNSTLTSARDISRYPHQRETLPRSSYDALARDNELTNSMSNSASGPDAQLQRGAQIIPSVHNSAPGPTYQAGSALRPQDYHSRSVLGRDVSSPVQNFANSQSVPLLGGPPTNFNQSDRPREQAAFLRHNQPLSQQQASSLLTQPGMHHTDGSPHRRPPSESGISQGAMRKSTSMHSLASHYSHQEHFHPHPPMPSHPKDGGQTMPRTGSMGNLRTVGNHPLLPSAQISSRGSSMAEPSFDDPSPPGSPVAESKQDLGPVTSTISAEMKCKVFLQQQHAQWKSFGSAKLKLYCQSPTNIKQLVVASNKSVLISTIVLTDGVERVGKTGVAIELSDKGARTGVIYMLQLQNETSAVSLFDRLLDYSCPPLSQF